MDISKMVDTVNATHADIEERYATEMEYQAALDASVFETRDILRRMEAESAKDRKWVIIGACASIIAAVGTIAGLIISFIIP